jgi:Peptidase C10 family/Spi protease inhibitor/Secretion system C-terminal sorting domain
MRRISALLCMLMIFVLSFGKQVDQNTAKSVGYTFFQSRSNSNRLKSAADLQLVYKAVSSVKNSLDLIEEATFLYIFNIGSNGFVIVSGDDNVMPILAYSDEGSFDPNNIPPNTSKWLEGYQSEILFTIENNIQPMKETLDEWQNLKNGVSLKSTAGNNSVSPLIQTKWNQFPFFNDLCPFDIKSNSRTVTGCVATAMAQIMKYWSYPTQGKGFNSYSDPNYGFQSANFANTTYNWASMPNIITSTNNSVATLMYHCGVSVNMHYGVKPSGSGAFVISSESVNCAENAYKTYFGYNSATIQGLQRVNYSFDEWKTLLKNELDNSRPIQYAGLDNGGGHTFVCDGYDVNDYFHINWGWGGMADAYYALDVLNPTQLGIGAGSGTYNSGQEAIIGIQPALGIPTINMNSSITVTPNPINFAQSFTVNADVINNGNSNFGGDICAAIFTSSGSFIDFIQKYSLSGSPLQPNFHYINGITFSTTGLTTVPGSYIIGIYYTDQGGYWNLVGNSSFTNPVSITINSPINYIQQYSPIVTTPSTFVQGQPASVNVNLVNDNTTTYYGTYQAALYDLSGNYAQTIGEYNETTGLPAGYTYLSPYITFSTSEITVAPGTYILGIEQLENGSSNWTFVGGQYYFTPVNIEVMAPPLPPDIYEPNDSQSIAYTLPLNWISNNAHILTTGSNINVGTDIDLYKINLNSGYNYSITARVHDSKNSGDGNTYTADVIWSYNKGIGWSQMYDDIMPGSILFNGSGTITFLVSPYFVGQTGTYLLDININRVSALGISELTSANKVFTVFPNPATNNLTVEFASNANIQQLRILNIIGQTIFEIKPTQSITNIYLSGFSNGIYILEATETGNTYTTKFVINK